MSSDQISDIKALHDKMGHTQRFAELSKEELLKLLEFRYNFLMEEMLELKDAIENKDAEGVVDALTDLNVVAIGTLHAFSVDAQRAWDAVQEANMAKEPGIKPSRPNPLKLPDMIKPEEWQGPSHFQNHGLLTEMFADE